MANEDEKMVRFETFTEKAAAELARIEKIARQEFAEEPSPDKREALVQDAIQKHKDSKPYNPKDMANDLPLEIQNLHKEIVKKENSRKNKGKDGYPGRREDYKQLRELHNQNDLFRKDPELYCYLKEQKVIGEEIFEAAGDKDSTINIVDHDGKLALQVKQASQPSLDFKIVDGAVIFNDESITEDQARSLRYFLEMSGIKNIKLPENLSAGIKEPMQKVNDELLEFGRNNWLSWWPERRAGGEELPENDGSNESFASGGPIDMSLPKLKLEYLEEGEKKSEPVYPSVYHAVKYSDNWHKINQKRLGENYTFHFSLLRGRAEYTIYKSGYKNAKGEKQEPWMTMSVKVRNGKLQIGYSVKDGEPINRSYADLIVEMYRDQGIIHVDLSNISNPDRAEFRMACARKGLIPVGVKLDYQKVRKMIEEAEKGADRKEDRIPWMLAMADQIELNARRKGTPVDEENRKHVKRLRGQARLFKFEHFYDNFLTDNVKEKNASGDAAAIIGSVQAAAYLIQHMSDNTSVDLMIEINKRKKKNWDEKKYGKTNSFDKMNEILEKYRGQNFDALLEQMKDGKGCYLDVPNENNSFGSDLYLLNSIIEKRE
ncbi:MAG: hypothetical protein LBL47_00035, partial [Lactobacillus sp.]|nr:hypothetical protein [Lactobacillus sp.]